MEIKGISSEILLSEGQRIERLDQVIQDLEELLRRAKRTSLVRKAGTYAKLCQLNNFIKAYAKHNPLYFRLFKPFLDFFKK